MASGYTITPASGTLTFSGTAGNTETVTVGGKVYTFQTTLTNVDGNVLIGANAAASAQNLYDAVNLTASAAGTTYAAAMTANTRVKATAVTATTVVFTALTPGEVGNLIASTETMANGAFGGGTLASGAGNVTAWVEDLFTKNQINAEVRAELAKLTASAD